MLAPRVGGTKPRGGAFAIRPDCGERNDANADVCRVRTIAAEATAWKGSGERFYCNEFCAEAEAAESPSLVPSITEHPHLAATSRGSA